MLMEVRIMVRGSRPIYSNRDYVDVDELWSYVKRKTAKEFVPILLPLLLILSLVFLWSLQQQRFLLGILIVLIAVIASAIIVLWRLSDEYYLLNSRIELYKDTLDLPYAGFIEYEMIDDFTVLDAEEKILRIDLKRPAGKVKTILIPARYLGGERGMERVCSILREKVKGRRGDMHHG